MGGLGVAGAITSRLHGRGGGHRWLPRGKPGCCYQKMEEILDRHELQMSPLTSERR